MKKILKNLLKILISFGLVVYLFTLVDLEKTIKALSESNIYLVLISIIFVILNYLFSSLRWKYLILNSDSISIWYLIKLYFIGSFFNNFLPTSIGGDAYKVLKLGDRIRSKTDAFTATFLERFLGMISLIIVAFIAILFYAEGDYFNKLIGLVLIVISFVVFMIFYPKFRFEHKFFIKITRILDQIHSSFLRYKNHKKTLFISFLASFFVQIFAVLSQYFLLLAVSVSVPILFSFFAFPVIFLSGYAIPTVNGLGSQDNLYLTFFSRYESDLNKIAAASILYHGVRFVVSLIGGVLYLKDRK